MTNQFKIIATLGALFLTSSPVFADTPVLNERQSNQKARIVQGVQSGELTRHETRKMLKGQVQLQRMENRAKADGVVTRNERVRLQHKANVESAKIAHNKHDRQKRAKAKD